MGRQSTIKTNEHALSGACFDLTATNCVASCEASPNATDSPHQVARGEIARECDAASPQRDQRSTEAGSHITSRHGNEPPAVSTDRRAVRVPSPTIKPRRPSIHTKSIQEKPMRRLIVLFFSLSIIVPFLMPIGCSGDGSSGGGAGTGSAGTSHNGGQSGSGTLASGGVGQMGGTTHSNSAGGTKATGGTVGAGNCADSAKSCVNMPCCSPYECISGTCGAPMAPTGGASSTGGSRSSGGTGT